MNRVEEVIGRLSEASINGPSRREFIKLLLTAGGSIIVSSLGLNLLSVKGDDPEGFCDQGGCSVPCDTRPYCLQRSVHYECSDCSPGTKKNCPINVCGGDKMCKHTCKRCCFPSSCTCNAWTITYNCVFCDPGGDCPQSQCLGCSGNCPSSPVLEENQEIGSEVRDK